MRRLHLGLALWGRLLARRDREVLRPLNQRVKRLGRLVGQVRDRDVVLELLEEVQDAPAPREEARRFHQFLSRLRDDGRIGRELLQAFLRTERDAHLLDQIRVSLDVSPPSTAARNLRHLLTDEHSSRWDRVRRAHRKARRRPSVDRLHRLRIRVRQLRHASDLVGVVDPKVARSIPVAFRRLQDHLGRLHDLDVAQLSLDVDLVDSPWGTALRARRRTERRAARRALATLAVAGPRPTLRRTASSTPGGRVRR
jgi:CHAD domain-containing protein